jgi:transposase InsO family protein
MELTAGAVSKDFDQLTGRRMLTLASMELTAGAVSKCRYLTMNIQIGFNANVAKELFNQETFFDLGEAARRLAAWIRFYNFRRTHHALGGLLVPKRHVTSDEPTRCWPRSSPGAALTASMNRLPSANASSTSSV